MTDAALGAAQRSGLVLEGEPLLVMLSGGADSVCLLDAARRLGAWASALHVNYGLREEADGDEEHCRTLCERLGVDLTVETVALPLEGNLQAHAREARYRLAEGLCTGDYAAAHTASDQAETVLMRLAVSPGRRALLGMEPRRGRLVRPLLQSTAEETRAYCRGRGLAWREDSSNTDPRFARARVRGGLLPALRSLGPAAERTVAETALQLRDEAEVLDVAVAQALAGLGGGPVVEQAGLASMPRALARLVLRELAESAAGGPRSLSRPEAESVLRLGEGGGSRSLDLGGGLQAVAEYGTLRFRLGGATAEEAPEAVGLTVPGTVAFGEWEVSARLGGGGEVAVSRAALGERALLVRGWRDGDRMRPVGLGGTKTLQDLFTDKKVPQALRRSLPVVEVSGEIVWVAGVATDERFLGEGPHVVGLSARRRLG
ncbi:MAG: tRNA lysidine(34) synthetase TilS [Thermoleophilaceae bacterium]|nr:tRNA lysidine(34) synthetase TilS [Thermoleophilaceae bacterium]